MPPDDDSAPGTVPPARRYTALAWGVIIVLCAVMVLIHQGRQEAPAPGESDEDTLGLMLMEMQAKYIIYTAHLQGGGDLLYQSAAQIDTGTIGQRLRFVVLAGELKGPEEGIGGSISSMISSGSSGVNPAPRRSR